MSIQCDKCRKEIKEGGICEHRGNRYCEDCYMDILSPPKACDPWAVYSAKSSLKGDGGVSPLTPRQKNIMNYIKEKKEVTAEEILKAMALSEEEWKREFAVLRHMELLGATKTEGKILYTMFNKNRG